MQNKIFSQYWREIVDLIHDGVMIVDVDGHIVTSNQALTDMTGFSREELENQPCSILNCCSCEISGKGGKHWCQLFSEGDVKNKRTIIVRKDNEELHVMKSASVIREGGRIIGAVETWTDITDLLEKEHLIEEFRRELQAEDFYDGMGGMIGVSPSIRQVFDMISSVAASDAPALILGESGTGKELAARAIHEHSNRKDRPYIQVNCAALNESVLESELFGHVKGSFTGAYQDRKGRFEAANGGTIFLDEIGDLPESIQVKLLRVLEEKVIERVGDNRSISVDVRIITATNRDLKRLVEEGRFRSDFYYRINVLPLSIPPLRQRREDIPVLAEAFFKRVQMKSNKSIYGLTPQAMEALVRYSWPGNIRELKSAFEYAVVICSDSHIGIEHLPPDITQASTQRSSQNESISLNARKKEALIRALEQAQGNKSQAARILGVSRVTVWNQMHRFGLI
jgi:PAS domain S-box-containing protein